jgi:F-type H+-transporting ATPase subunit b
MLNEKFWLAIAFFVFLAALVKYAFPSIGKSLGDKSKQIADEIAEAKRIREVAENLLKKAEKHYLESTDYAAKLIKDAESESEKFAAESKKTLEIEIAKKTAAALERIKMEEVNAIAEIKSKIVSTALQNVTAELSNITPEQQAALVQQSIKKLEQATS